jgi:radical SAM superfamily enzyme YgiQ (UPF0313 family)
MNNDHGIMGNGTGVVQLTELTGINPVPLPQRTTGRVLLLKPPYFTPWTPPLGIAILKSFLREYGIAATCFDFNVDPDLWGMHHRYFETLQEFDRTILNDGYSRLWWILNAHMLAFANRSSEAEIASMLEVILPLYGVRTSSGVSRRLLSLVANYYRRLDEVTESIDFSQYSVVGTSTYTTSLGSSLWLLRKAKEQFPGIKTIMGGGAFADDLALGSDNLEILLRDYDFIDHVVLGEGEMLLLQLLNGTLSHKRVISLADLSGITLNMKDVPSPDFSDFSMENYYHLTIEGARSCPFQCSFCSETIQWGEYRKKPIEILAEQVLELSRSHGVREFFMGDSLMNPYLIPFANELLKREGNILYDGYLRADSPVTHKKHVEKWAASGLFRVRLGIESAAANVLKAMDKKTSPEVIAKVLKTLAASGIRTTTYWIVGFPGETEADFQETCNFIRANANNIYELEAHPYYYYPYGQVGSRLYQCKELYPDEVISLTHFKVWDIVGVEPARDVRYERLKRLCALASELKLPNMYTMAERYAAEDRWRSLHPQAVEIYPGGLSKRETTAGVAEMPALSNCLITTAGEVVCCHALVAKNLDETTLRASLRKLREYHEILQMRLDEDRYVRQTEEAESEMDGLRVVEDFSPDAIQSLTADMSPARGLSVRVGIVRQEGSTGLMLCGHRGILDPASVARLLEDLFRIYEQLSNGREISLLSTSIPYSQAESIVTSPKDRFLPGSNGGGAEVHQEQTLLLEHFQANVEFSAATVAAACTAAQAAALQNLAVLIDPRILTPPLEGTLGLLTRLFAVQTVAVQPGLYERIQNAKGLMQCALSDPGSTNGLTSATVLLNLEYLVQRPWLEEDTWQSLGFKVDSGTHRCRFDVEILVLPKPNGVDVRVLRKDTSNAVLAAKISQVFISELSLLLEYCESAREAERFWCSEFGPPITDKDAVSLRPAIPSIEDIAVLDCEVPFFASQGGGKEYISILAAFIAVLGRGQAINCVDIAIEVEGPSSQFLPLRVPVTKATSFVYFTEAIKSRLEQAFRHGSYSQSVLQRFTTPEAVPFGFLVAHEERTSREVFERILRHGFDLTLVLTSGLTPRLRLVCRPGFDMELAASVRNWLTAMLQVVGGNQESSLDGFQISPEITQAVVVPTRVPELDENFRF